MWRNMADALDLESSEETHGGSTPSIRIKDIEEHLWVIHKWKRGLQIASLNIDEYIAMCRILDAIYDKIEDKDVCRNCGGRGLITEKEPCPLCTC